MTEKMTLDKLEDIVDDVTHPLHTVISKEEPFQRLIAPSQVQD